MPPSYYKYPRNSKQKKRRKDLTYILGAHCRDGVVLVADKRFTVNYGSDYVYGIKLIDDIDNVIIGFSGDRGLFEIFRTRIRNYVRNYRESTDRKTPHNDELLDQITKTTSSLDREFRGEKFETLVGIKEGESSSLRHFDQDGRHVPVETFQAIGGGAPYGAIFLKTLWEPDLTMQQVAEIAYITIHLIDELGLNYTVGMEPDAIFEKYCDIRFMPHAIEKPIHDPEPEFYHDLQLRAEAAQHDLYKTLQKILESGNRNSSTSG